MSELEFAWPRMLIVDDVEDNRAILNRWFRWQGYEIAEASSGQSALAMIGSLHFDIVLLDMMMPGMCGIETLRHIRERYTAEKLPVIMVSARTEIADVVDALELGANDYISKPINFEIAKARVATQIEHKRALDHLARTVTELSSTIRQLEREILDMRKVEAREMAGDNVERVAWV